MIGEDAFLDFLCVGAPRSGTTWLAAALSEHPEAWIPPCKEVHFFNRCLLYPAEYKFPRGAEYYRSYFRDAPDGARLGDVSPFTYLDPNAAFRVATTFPDARILVMLREPVEMVYSLYVKRSELERRKRTFEEEIRVHPMFLDLGHYDSFLAPYFDHFPEESIRVVVYEEFFEDTARSYAATCRFLGLDETFRPSVLDKRVHERADAPSWLRRVLYGSALRALNWRGLIWLKDILYRYRVNRQDYEGLTGRKRASRVPPMRPETRAELTAMYAPGVERLERRLGISLDAWRKPA